MRELYINLDMLRKDIKTHIYYIKENSNENLKI